MLESKSNGTRKSEDHQPVETDAPAPDPNAPLVGPSMAPAAEMEVTLDEGSQSSVPASPYSANRALLRDLTLPTLPNYDIPPSPPGSPKESTNAKFKNFLELKKQGVHFNQKLAKSSALKNPSLMQKLLDFSDIDENSQYATTLPADLWNPGAFPEYAYKEGLLSDHKKVQRKAGERVGFVEPVIPQPKPEKWPVKAPIKRKSRFDV